MKNKKYRNFGLTDDDTEFHVSIKRKENKYSNKKNSYLRSEMSAQSTSHKGKQQLNGAGTEYALCTQQLVHVADSGPGDPFEGGSQTIA